MALRSDFFKRTFNFHFNARTSRGPMQDRTCWFIRIWDEKDPSIRGIGECAPLPGLSVDDRPDLELILRDLSVKISLLDRFPSFHEMDDLIYQLVPRGNPSVTFALEVAFLDLLSGGRKLIFDNDFVNGKPIPINGLIWMGTEDFMMEQVHEKILKGYGCIKLKVGGLDFDRECRILQAIRDHYGDTITIRLDANGAFSEKEVITKLETLSRFTIHSIEQPLKPGSKMMPSLSKASPIPIALDEELIGKELVKEALLESIQPSYIILKPTLHGGLIHSDGWIKAAQQRGIGWWITSALESNIGLNAICQFTANYAIDMPQGLGTGLLYTDNIESPLSVKNGEIFWDDRKSWQSV